MWGLLTAVAMGGAVDAAILKQRVAETAELRGKRVTTDAPPIPTEAYDKIASGEVWTTLQSVPGHKAKKAIGAVVVDVPIGRMWAAVNDETSKVDWTKLGYLELIEGSNCEDQRLVLQYLPISLVSDRWWVVRQTMNDALFQASEGRVREVKWTSTDERPTTATAVTWMDKGIPIAYTHGSWFMVDLDGQNTLIEYYTWTDPGGSIPAGLASSFAAGGISDTFETMAKLAKNGTNCPVK